MTLVLLPLSRMAGRTHTTLSFKMLLSVALLLHRPTILSKHRLMPSMPKLRISKVAGTLSRPSTII